MEKLSATKPKASRNKKVMMVRAEINEIQDRKTIEKFLKVAF